MGLLKTVFEVNLGLFGASRGGCVVVFYSFTPLVPGLRPPSLHPKRQGENPSPICHPRSCRIDSHVQPHCHPHAGHGADLALTRQGWSS